MRLIKIERPQNKHLVYDSETQRRRATKHGYSKEPWYSSYKGMMQRCYLHCNPNYAIYGGRGISVCDEWHDINKFAEWVKVSNYSVGLTIERIDSNGNYSPENCTWATPKQQANNRRNTTYIDFEGKTKSLAEWADFLGINRYTLWSRINKQGWNIDRAFNTKVGAKMDGKEKK